MPLELQEFSIVVTANDYNPSILNPDFLALNGIVKDDWEWSVTPPPITTPPFATVQYDSNISIVVETNTLLVRELNLSGNPESSKVVEIVKQYVNCLQHIRYAAVGINFKFAVHVDSPLTFLKDRFLSQGPWDSEVHPLSEVGLILRFDVNNSRLTLTLDNALLGNTSDNPEDAEQIIFVSANFHRDCIGYPSYEQVLSFLDCVEPDWRACMTTLSDVIEND